MDSDEDIKTHLELSAKLLLGFKRSQSLYAGFSHIIESGIDLEGLENGQPIPSDLMQVLLEAAKTDADAYAACETLAGLAMRSGSPLPPSLHNFAAKALLDRDSRPKRGRRSRGQGTTHDITRYIFLKQALEFFHLQKGKGLRTENKTKGKANYQPDAFELVAAAFTKAGLATTEHQLKNLLNHPSKAPIRKIGDWAIMPIKILTSL